MRRGLLLLCTALLVAAVSWGLGSYALLDPDEGRNAEVAREMMASGDFVLPHLDGLPYLDKPVLFFAADALSQRLLGAGEAAARLPSLLFALATAALTGWFAGRLFGPRARAIAAVAALAAPLPIAFARTVIFDSALTTFTVLALCAFYLAVEARAARRSAAVAPGAGDAAAAAIGPEGPGLPYLRWTALAWAAMGLGVLTKGPVALAVPLLAAAPFAVYRRASRAVWHPLGPALLVLCTGPWIWAMSRRVPEFLHYALVTETWQRVTTPQMNREGSAWFYVPCLLAGALPWSVLVLAGWRRSLRLRGADGAGSAGFQNGRRPSPRPRGDDAADPADLPDGRRPSVRTGRGLDPRRLYLALWVAVPFVLFSLSHSKRPQYVLPLLPAVAIMAAKVWADARGTADAAETAAAPAEDAGAGRPAGAPAEPAPAAAPAAVPGARAAGFTWLVLALLCAAAPAVLPRIHSARLVHVTMLPPTLLALGAAFLLGAAAVLLGAGRRGSALLLAGLVLPMAALPPVLLPLLDEIGSHRSARAAAAAIAPRLVPGAEVVAVHAFPPSLPFYLRRTLLLATPRGRELTSNYVIAYFQKWLAADPRSTPLRPADWWRGALAACDHPLVFVTWADDAANRATLAAAGLPLIVANDRMAAYGPCAVRAGHPSAR
ncbi:MAG TPA: glycosyltransferase family 39 protein [Thermoanaerobaculia bacterium]|nr:glycosyltransferase family 39 protein [Thermoanaerobaculia bacterium]